jgi:membrane associated rhomboid family serine protease
MFFFPYATDAPLYHWPFTTVVIIVANVVVFVLEVRDPGLAHALSLQAGRGMYQYQWLTHAFAHLNFMHILGNMLFLWTFGLIVEGKLGWWKTLAVYLGIGLVDGAIVQFLVLSHPGQYVLGASGIIYAFMAMSLVWAPENSVKCVLVVAFRIALFDVTIKVVVGLFLALQVIILLFNHMALSSELLHVAGAIPGFCVAIWLLKTKRVDCENWDFFSVLANRHRMTEKERKAETLDELADAERQKRGAEQRSAEALQWIRDQLRDGNLKAALEVCHRMSVEQPQWVLPQADLQCLIGAMLRSRLTVEAVPLMGQFVVRFPNHATPMRFKLAQVLIHQQRPAQALKVLARVPEAGLDRPESQLLLQLRQTARELREKDPYEIADEDW